MDEASTLIAVDLKVHLDVVSLKVNTEQLATGMDAELNRFQEFFMSQGNAPLMKMERAILKTYLAWKLLHEEGCPATQD